MKRYINFTDIRTGFNPDIIKRLAEENNVHNMEEKDRHVLIAFDEMKIKSGLVYHKGSGKLIGFTELGDLNDEFSRFTCATNEKDNQNDE